MPTLLILPLLIVLTACNLYQSSDREVFNSQAYLNIPAKKQAVPVSQTCETAEAPGLAVEPKIAYINEHSEVLLTEPLSNQRTLVCRLIFEGTPSEEALLSSSRAYIEEFIAKNPGL